MARKKPANTSDDYDDVVGSAPAPNASSITAAEMLQFIERFESLEADKKAIMADQKDLMAEAKGRGYDTKAMKVIIRERAANPDDLAEFQSIVELYRQSLGMG